MLRLADSPGRARQNGYTLIELLASTFILTVGVMVAWSAIMTSTVKTAGRAQELADLQTEVRRAVDTLAADLRQAQCRDATTLPVTTATTTQVTFYSPDRLTPYHLRQVSYRLSGGQFQRAFATSTTRWAALDDPVARFVVHPRRFGHERVDPDLQGRRQPGDHESFRRRIGERQAGDRRRRPWRRERGVAAVRPFSTMRVFSSAFGPPARGGEQNSDGHGVLLLGHDRAARRGAGRLGCRDRPDLDGQRSGTPRLQA